MSTELISKWVTRSRGSNLNRWSIMRAGILAACAALILFTGACATSCVKTGHVGVVTRFGKVMGTALPEGVNLVSPLNLVHDMSVQTQEMKETMDAPSSEGLIFKIEA